MRYSISSSFNNLSMNPSPQILIIYQWIAKYMFFIGENRILQLLEKKLNFIFTKFGLKTVKCSAKNLIQRTLFLSSYKIINLQDPVTNLLPPSVPQTCQLYRNWKVLDWSPAASYVDRWPLSSNHPNNV